MDSSSHLGYRRCVRAGSGGLRFAVMGHHDLAVRSSPRFLARSSSTGGESPRASIGFDDESCRSPALPTWARAARRASTRKSPRRMLHDVDFGVFLHENMALVMSSRPGLPTAVHLANTPIQMSRLPIL